MAYSVSNKFKEMVYSGNSLYATSLKINGEEIEETLIESITISNPIVDDSSNSFYIGTFISQSLKIKFRNLDGLNINSGDNVTLDMGICVNEANETYETIPIGKYIIDELSEDYKTTCEITCLDYAVKFKPNVDYSVLVKNNKSVTLKNLLIWLCNHYGVELGIYPSVNNDVTTTLYDNTVSGKRYISYIAEMFGGNAKIGRDGKLNIIPLKNDYVDTINAEEGKTWDLGEKYKISGVTWSDALRNFSYGNSNDNVLYIRTDNMFVTKTGQISNIYNSVKDFEIYSIKEENIADISLDAWDIIRFQFDGKYYLTLNNNETTYSRSLMTKIETKIPTSSQEVTTNVVGNEQANYRRLKTTVDLDNNQISIISAEIGDRGERETSITQDLDSLTSRVLSVPTITTEDGDVGSISLENLKAEKIISLKVHPTTKDILGLFASKLLKASEDLKALSRKVYFNGNENLSFLIPANLYCLDDDYDEFVYDGVNEKIYIIRKIGIDDNGDKYLLDEPVTEDYDYYDFIIGEGNYNVFMSTYPTAYIYLKAMIKNDYTDSFATRYEMSSEINQTAESINSVVKTKVDETEIISKINQSAEEISIEANKINLNGSITANKTFKIDTDGSMEATGGKIGNWIITNEGLTNSAVKLNSDGSSTIYTVADLIIIRGYIMGYQGFDLSTSMINHYDLTGDGQVTSQDYIRLQNLIGISMTD